MCIPVVILVLSPPDPEIFFGKGVLGSGGRRLRGVEEEGGGERWRGVEEQGGVDGEGNSGGTETNSLLESRSRDLF